MTTAQDNFRKVAPGYMKMFWADFGVSTTDAAAVFGNLGYESKGLTDDQEDKPVVPGSRGGLNWAQWTGPRRRAFEAYCARTGKDANSDSAAYAWLYLELKNEEKGAITALINADTLEAKTIAFEKSYLRAGAKNYAKRYEWAQLALSAYNTAFANVAEPEPVKGKTMNIKDWFDWQILQGLIRNVLSVAGGTLVSQGLLTTDDLNTGIGALMVLAGVIAGLVSAVTKKKALEVVKAVKASPLVDIGTSRATGKATIVPTN